MDMITLIVVVRKEGTLLQVTHVNTTAPQPIERNSPCHFVPESSSHAAFLVPLVAERSVPSPDPPQFDSEHEFDVDDFNYANNGQDSEPPTRPPSPRPGSDVLTCHTTGSFLPNNAVPPPWEDPGPDDFSPFRDRADFELAELLYRDVQMPKSSISRLMQIWACKLDDPDDEPPFLHAEDLYDTIDAIELSDVAWQSFSVSYNGTVREGEDAPWKRASYELWFRDPLQVLKNQLANRDFAKEMDIAPKKDLMSGQWAWRQADIIASEPRHRGSVFCPIVLGSDKTTVSVATGQNEYYPLYLSNGLIHNNVRRAHRNGVSLIAFLAIPKTDRENEDSDESRRFRRHLFQGSLARILHSVKPNMTDAIVLRFADSHYRKVIGDYPGQVQLICIVQGWCPKCTAKGTELDGLRGRRTHELTVILQSGLTTSKLWKDYGIVDGIMPFTHSFLRADIHELLSPDILHQLIKGVFKDHLVTWVESYIKSEHEPSEAAKILAEIDRRIAAAPHFPGLRRFKEGRGFKQWTGKDSKALMKVYLPAITGLVPARMVRAVRYFIDFCYYARRSILDDNDLTKLDELLSKFHEEREIFREVGVREKGFNLPRQHALTHYRQLIVDFGAPSGLCSSITESKHIEAIKEPYRRSNRNHPLAQILQTNQQMDKLNAALHGRPSPQVVKKLKKLVPDNKDNDEAATDDPLGATTMACTAVRSYPRDVDSLATKLGIPSLSEHISRDLSGVHGMHRERIRSTESWSKGPERRDCVFVVHSDDLPGLRGMDVAQVKLLHIVYYPCALVSWFSVVGDEPCPDTGMWRVEPDFDQNGDRSMSVVHLEAILRGAHLAGIPNDEFLPHQLKHTNSLTSFRAFYVNRFIDYHAHEIIS
ncbi:hypothetical protein F5887DRAFT_1060897 [Amanita rubescens]|nr:hypothetical protein F5887DRAFT_1060897 [Amanita rubescens]